MKNGKVDFSIFVSGLLAEGLIALGAMKNPVTQKIQKNLDHAGMVIDTLVMLKEKTAGNLTEEESAGLEQTIHQLRMGYVSALEKRDGEGKGESGKKGEK